MGLVTSNICLLRWWLLVLTVVSTATSSASEYGASDYAHYQGSCKHAYQYHNERGKKHSTSLPAAYPPASYPSELSPVDWYATKALPEGYPALGWVVHTNGKCSFRGSQMPRCPEEADKHGSYELKEDGEECDTGKECCSHKCISGTCCPHFKFPPGKWCDDNEDCCSGKCDFGKCCEPGKTVSRGDCTQGDDCCSGVCREAWCCPPHTLPSGKKCKWDSQCCSDQCYFGKCCPRTKRLTNADCTEDAQCCSDVCADQKCCEPGRRLTNSTCTQSKECCNSRCLDNKCCPPNQKGSGPAAVCTFDDQCCSGVCEPLTTINATGLCCAPGARLANETCSSSEDCCNQNCVNGRCCPTNKKVPGQPCSNSTECCSDVCEAGFCCARGKRPRGQACVQDTECCSGKCNNRTCETCGKPLEAQCNDKSECCSGVCSKFPGNEFIGRPDPRQGECCLPGLLPRGEVCTTSADCCNGVCQLADGFSEGLLRCCAPGTLPFLASCTQHAECCGDNCVDGQCSNPTCFSGDSTVRVRGYLHPVTMRELRTGQHVECLHSGSDLMAPTTPTWCEVINFAHADGVTVQQQRLSFSRPDGSSGSITVTPTHLVYKLTANTLLTHSAGSVNAFGPFKLVAARDVQPGDRLVVGASPVDASAGFVVGSVTAVEGVQAQGLYLPVIEHPYLVVDGVVMPLWTWTGVPLITPPGAAGAPNALLHYTFAPLFMQHMQPLHTPGLQGKWGNSSMWPGVQTVLSSLHSKQAAASGRMAVDFSAAQDLFLPRYHAWKAAQADHSSSPAGVGEVPEAITLEQVLMTLDAVMVPLHQQ